MATNNMLFIDTSALFAFMVPADPDHKAARLAFQKYHTGAYKLITTDYVADELFTLLRCRAKISIKNIIAIFEDLTASSIQLFGVKREIFQDSLTLMAKYKDHYFSFTDCVSFQVMKDLKIKNVLTTDKHFSVAGFKNLLLK